MANKPSLASLPHDQHPHASYFTYRYNPSSQHPTANIARQVPNGIRIVFSDPLSLSPAGVDQDDQYRGAAIYFEGRHCGLQSPCRSWRICPQSDAAASPQHLSTSRGFKVFPMTIGHTFMTTIFQKPSYNAKDMLRCGQVGALVFHGRSKRNSTGGLFGFTVYPQSAYADGDAPKE